ncbi:MAG: hypothetical protein RR900_02560, partial [Ruthenibacterium sp.]
HSAPELYEAIQNLRVRGAPAIGIFAAYAFYVLARQANQNNFCHDCLRIRDFLCRARPTAVNLQKMLDRMLLCTQTQASVPTMLAQMKAEAFAIHQEDIAMCRAILREKGLALELDDVPRVGVHGKMRSLYLRDPDENLIELCHYE